MNVRKTILFKFTNSDLLLALVESLNLKYSGFEGPYYKVIISNWHKSIEGGGYECVFQYRNQFNNI